MQARLNKAIGRIATVVVLIATIAVAGGAAFVVSTFSTTTTTTTSRVRSSTSSVSDVMPDKTISKAVVHYKYTCKSRKDKYRSWTNTCSHAYAQVPV